MSRPRPEAQLTISSAQIAASTQTPLSRLPVRFRAGKAEDLADIHDPSVGGDDWDVGDDQDDAGAPDDEWDEDAASWERPGRRTAPVRRDLARHSGPRLVQQGRSGRVGVDSDERAEPVGPVDQLGGLVHDPDKPFSSYDVATHGPDPAPDWLVTSLSALDTRLGTLKSGKEADVGLMDRSLPGGPGCLLAVKQYRSGEHRLFHRDAGYLEGRRVRRSREGRAMAARTGFGRELLSAQWAGAEFAALGRLWHAGARVPYPVQLIGSELMMEFIGGPDGTAAPRLIAADCDRDEFETLWESLVLTLELLAHEGVTHGDLSPYNVLVHDGECVVIDLPQVVDIVANPQGGSFLDRDCGVIADFFARRGVRRADGELLSLHLAGIARRT